jgi:[FeFe] hydrogenase H-cluster maturation GTPase HydF
MSSLNETPSANRIHIAFFGLRNAGKSTLVNAFTGQPVAIVSDVPGTTTDPVSKAMEILPLGPCQITDTAGLDDVGALGEQRVERTLNVLATTDLAIWVWGETADEASPWYQRFCKECASRRVATLVYHRGESVEELKKKVAAVQLVDDTPGLLDGLVEAGDFVVCVCPIDESAPKGRLILPQVQVIRDCLDRNAICAVCQPGELAATLCGRGEALVITDSQAFAAVDATVRAARAADSAREIRLTSFSILFARQKGDLAAYLAGLKAIEALKDGDVVLVAEGCTHHRQCNDIGTTKIPKALAKLTGGKKIDFAFASGKSFPLEREDGRRVALVVHCGGCMLSRREVLRRIAACGAASVPIVNYGLLLAKAAGVVIDPEIMV